MVFPELSNLLSWPTGVPPAGQTVFIADAHKDASFLLHHFIGASLKAGHHVCLVSFAQILPHYINASKKMGINITQYQEQKTFTFIDCMTRLLDENATETCTTSTASTSARADTHADATTTQPTTTAPASSTLNTFTLNWNGNPLRRLYALIEEVVAGRDDVRHVLIIDDLSIPVAIGVADKHVAAFFDACQALVSSLSSTANSPRGNLIALAHDPFEPKSQSKTICESWLCQYCAFRAHTTLCTKELSTGISREIHGQLTVVSRDGTPVVGQRHYHFKITDATVAFFARGTSSAVL